MPAVQMSLKMLYIQVPSLGREYRNVENFNGTFWRYMRCTQSFDACCYKAIEKEGPVSRITNLLISFGTMDRRRSHKQCSSLLTISSPITFARLAIPCMHNPANK